MSRFILCALLLAGIHDAVEAQIIRGYGVQFGVASTNVIYDGDIDPGDFPRQSDPFDFERRYGFAVSGFVEWMDEPNVSLLTKGTFIQKGFAVEHEGRDPQNNPVGTYKTTTQVNYLSAAVPLKVRAGVRSVAPFVSIGPRLDVIVGGDPTGRGSAADAYESPIFGWDASAGLEVDRPNHADLLAEIIYGWDRTSSLSGNDLNLTAHQNAVTITVGLRWK